MENVSIISALIACGVMALWLAYALEIPSIVLLLGIGIIIGPFSGLVNPDAILGVFFQPLVSLSVALILFEGGLGLKYEDVRSEKNVLIRLLTAGVCFTWISGCVLATFLTGMKWSMAFLVGAVLTVTGPTVIIPLLRHIKLSGKIGAIIKWEGITIDPIGATLSVLVFEVIRAGGTGFSLYEITKALLMTILTGGLTGYTAAAIIVYALKRYWVPDLIQGPFTLVSVLAVYSVSNHFQHESGLLGVTVMGIMLANQKSVPIQQILEFIENLCLILVSFLFILLSSRLTIEDLLHIDFRTVVFTLCLILFIRPAAVYFSTIKSNLSKKEKVFLAFIAPRGIVAASVASIFSLELTGISYPGSEKIVPVVFFVILTTVLFYGFFSPFLARRLELVNPNPQGILFAGAGALSREIALVLKQEGFLTILVDTSRNNVTASKMAGLTARIGSILSDRFMEMIDFGDIKCLLCLTSNEEMNALACQKFKRFFGTRETYQLPYIEGSLFEPVPLEHRGRFLFRKDLTIGNISALCGNSPQVKVTNLSGDFSYEDFLNKNIDSAIPLFIIKNNGQLEVITVDETVKPVPGDKIISLLIDED